MLWLILSFWRFSSSFTAEGRNVSWSSHTSITARAGTNQKPSKSDWSWWFAKMSLVRSVCSHDPSGHSQGSSVPVWAGCYFGWSLYLWLNGRTEWQGERVLSVGHMRLHHTHGFSAVNARLLKLPPVWFLLERWTVTLNWEPRQTLSPCVSYFYVAVIKYNVFKHINLLGMFHHPLLNRLCQSILLKKLRQMPINKCEHMTLCGKNHFKSVIKGQWRVIWTCREYILRVFVSYGQTIFVKLFNFG